MQYPLIDQSYTKVGVLYQPSVYSPVVENYPVTQDYVAATNYTKLYPTVYPEVYPEIYPEVYPAAYPVAYPTAYPIVYPVAYPQNYPTVYPQTYPGTYPTVYPKTYPKTYPGTYPKPYPRTYPKTYPKTYTKTYPKKYPIPTTPWDIPRIDLTYKRKIRPPRKVKGRIAIDWYISNPVPLFQTVFGDRLGVSWDQWRPKELKVPKMFKLMSKKGG